MPTPMSRTATPAPSAATVLALGAWLKNSACLCQGGRVQWTAVHGDLSDPQSCMALRASALALIRQARASGGPPLAALAHDLHPDFYSSQLAQELAAELGLPAVAVQHHRAHIGAVMAAHGLDEPVLGLALDGFGLGSDGGAWGGELLWLEGAQWQRLGHLHPLALPGGDQAARQPWRMAASALHACGLGAQIGAHWGARVGASRAATVQQMLARGLNCPLSSSAGRWFDAAAAALGLCLEQDDEAQAAVALEQAAARALERGTPLPDLPLPSLLPGAATQSATGVGTGFDATATPLTSSQILDLRPPWLALHEAAAPLRLGRTANATLPTAPDRAAAPPSAHTAPAPSIAAQAALAAAFHLRLADGLADWVLAAARARQTRSVALAGGCFYNRILRQRLQARLIEAGQHVYLQTAQGCGDAGLALGQAWVAAQELAAAPCPASFYQENPLCV